MRRAVAKSLMRKAREGISSCLNVPGSFFCSLWLTMAESRVGVREDVHKRNGGTELSELLSIWNAPMDRSH